MRSLTRALTAVLAISLASAATALTPPTQRQVMRFVPGRIAVAPASPALELGPEFTIEAWIFLEAYQPWAYLLGKVAASPGAPPWDYLLFLTEDGRHLQFQQSSGAAMAGIQDPTELPLRTWTHVAATLGADTMRLFVGGSQVASGPSPGPPPANALPFGVGGAIEDSGWPNANFTGAVRQVRVWSRALPAEELRARDSALTGDEPGLLACWPLDDGSGQSARDLGPNHLALRRGLAAAWDEADPGWIHTAVLDAGPFFSLEGPFEVVPGCDNVAIPCLGVGTVIDFDSDGVPDLLLTRAYFNPTRAFPYAPMVCLHNDGHGGFTDVSVTVCPQARNRTMANFAVADFDGDGRQDLLVADGGPDHAFGPGGQNHLLLQTPDGRLEDATAERLPLRNVFTHTVCAADFSGDAKADVFVGTIFTATGAGALATGPRLHVNDGHGHFSRGVAGLPPEIARGGAWTSAAVDVDRDGDLDLVMSSGMWPMNDTLLINDGSGSFTLAPENALPERHTAPYGAAMHMTSADLDGDGWPDLLHFEQTPEQALARLCLFLNNHDRTFRDASSQIVLDSSDAPVDNVGYPRIVDLDRDGRPDFVFGTYGGNGPRPMLNAGGGLFVDGSEFWPLLRPSGQVLPADFDGDGDVDVIIDGAMGSSIWLLRQVKAPDLRLLKGDPRPPRRRAGGS